MPGAPIPGAGGGGGKRDTSPGEGTRRVEETLGVVPELGEVGARALNRSTPTPNPAPGAAHSLCSFPEA